MIIFEFEYYILVINLQTKITNKLLIHDSQYNLFK